MYTHTRRSCELVIFFFRFILHVYLVGVSVPQQIVSSFPTGNGDVALALMAKAFNRALRVYSALFQRIDELFSRNRRDTVVELFVVPILSVSKRKMNDLFSGIYQYALFFSCNHLPGLQLSQ